MQLGTQGDQCARAVSYTHLDVYKRQVHATVATEKLENINSVFDRMRRGQIEGRIVLDMAA